MNLQFTEKTPISSEVTNDLLKCTMQNLKGNIMPMSFFVQKVFMESFVYNAKFEGKRFQRFVKKSLDNMCDFIIENFCMKEKESPYEFVFDFIAAFLDGVLPRRVQNLIWSCSCDEYIETTDLEKIIKEQFKETCKYQIMLNQASRDVGEENYMKCVPETPLELMFFFQTWLNRTLICIRRHEYPYKEKDFEELKTENKKLKKEKEEQERSAKMQIKILKDRIKQTEEKDADSDLRKKYAKLYHEKQQLERKYEQLKQAKEEKKEEEKKEVKKEDKELRKDLKYMFVVNSDIYLANNIREQFPNAVMKVKGFEQVKGVDAVVFVTGNITHEMYTHAKRYCQKLNIPMVHSARLNMEQIIKDMENGLKNEEKFWKQPQYPEKDFLSTSE